MYGILGGFGISIGPILHFGSDELKQRLVGPLLRGEIRSCLAITEAEGGSDVANLTRSARKSEDGKRYIVNGCASNFLTSFETERRADGRVGRS